MIIGWSIGFFGLLGIMQQIINMRDLNIASICVIAFAILLMYFIKPELKIPVTFVQRVIGYTSAIVAGVLYGFNTLPSKYLSERIGHSSHLIDYIFSHSTGIIVTSTGAYLIYWICCPKRYHESISYRKLTIPALSVSYTHLTLPTNREV